MKRDRFAPSFRSVRPIGIKTTYLRVGRRGRGFSFRDIRGEHSASYGVVGLELLDAFSGDE